VTNALAVLWLYGPPGVGKTTVAWAFCEQLWRDGVRAAYVDIDQLGMCFGPPTSESWSPEPAEDPERHRLKTLNLDAVAANARDAGAACLVVSGVIDAEHGIDLALLPNAAPTTIRLRAETEVLRQRLEARARPGQDYDEIAEYASVLERCDGPCVDTTGLSVDEVRQQICKHVGDWPGHGTAARGALAEPAPSGRILRVSGPREDGKSMIGWRIYRQMRLDGTRSAFVDLVQLGFLRPADAADPGNRRLRAANLAAVWRTFRAAGAECLVAAEPLPGTEDGFPGSAAAERPII
jgi:broad-specificity NMP kinase